jgi:hypothetical protein
MPSIWRTAHCALLSEIKAAARILSRLLSFIRSDHGGSMPRAIINCLRTMKCSGIILRAISERLLHAMLLANSEHTATLSYILEIGADPKIADL